MMPDASNYLQEKVLKAIAQGQSFSVANVYVGLLLTPSVAYAPGREPTDANYARQKVTLSSPKYAKDDPTCMEATNPSAVSFPVAQYAWGTLEYYALFDGAGEDANMLFSGKLQTPIKVGRWGTAVIPAGSLSVRVR